MKKLFQDLKKGTFHEIELDSEKFEVKTSYGEFKSYYWDDHKISVKTFKKLESAQKNFESNTKKWLEKGYKLSDPKCPLALRNKIDECKKKQLETLHASIHHEDNFEEIFQLTHLKSLTISIRFEGIKIPESITNLVNLETLEFKGSIKNIPLNIGDLKNLKYLEFDTETLRKIPECITNCKNLEVLRVRGNGIQDLPENLGNLTNLKLLWVYGYGYANNRFKGVKEIPASIGRCKNLEKIYISDCHTLQGLPKEFGNLKALKHLTINECNLSEFPESITGCTNLETLRMDENRFKTLPDSIGNLQKLQKIEITSGVSSTSSCLESLPDGLFKLTNLKTLDLENNKIKIIPEGMKNLVNLDELNLEDNPISNMPRELSDQGKEAIFWHFGWLKMEGDLSIENDLTEEEKKQLIKDYHPYLDDYMKYHDKSWETHEMRSVERFITFQGDKIPRSKYSREFHRHSALAKMWKLIPPLPEWSEITHRLMVMLVYDWGQVSKLHDRKYREQRWGDIFFLWYAVQIDNNQEPDYEEVVKVLKKYGRDKNAFDACLSHLYYKLTKDDQPTKFGKVVLQYFKDQPEELVAKMTQNDSSFLHEVSMSVAKLLIRFDPKRFAKYAEQWFFSENILTYVKENNRSLDFDYGTFQLLKETNPKQYEDFSARLLDLPIAVEYQLSVASKLYTKNNKKYKDKALALFEQKLYLLKNTWDNSPPLISLPNKEDVRNIEFAQWLLKNFKKELKNDFLEMAQEEDKMKGFSHYIPFLLNAYKKDAYPILAELLKNEINLKTVFEGVEKHDYSEHHDLVWKILLSKEEKHRALAAKELHRLYDAKTLLEKIPDLVASKKMPQRDSGMQLLMLLNEDKKAQKLLQEAFKAETDVWLREKMIRHYQTNDPKFLEKELLSGLDAAKENGKLKKPTKKWLDGVKLPDLIWKDGKKADKELAHYLFYLQKDRKQSWYEPCLESSLIIERLDKSKCGDFAKKVWDLILKHDGLKATIKPVAAIFSTLGDDRIIQPLQNYCTNRNNVLAPSLLGNIGNEKAARALDSIMLYYKTKYPNVKNAATEAFDKIADTMGIDKFALMDRIIPDFGFEDLFKTFEVEGQQWRAFINSDLKLSYLNESDEVKKTIPKKAAKEIKDEFKQLNKEIRSIAKNQLASMENNLITQRRWDTEAWKNHFMTKPLTFAFAQSLIWGIYKKGKLTDLFAVNQDQTLEKADFDEITLPKNAQIGLIHPLELNETQSNAWKNYLEENKITQVFEQLHRPIFTPEKIELTEGVLQKYVGKEVSDYRFRSHMGKRGWKRGSVVDSGMVANYKKAYEEEGIEIFIEVEEMYIHLGEYSENIILDDLYFMKHNTVRTGSYVYDSHRGDNDSRLIKVKELPPIIYSETIHDFESLLNP